ncbi:hypothetical protein PL10110_620046 [Planktothrix agardhii]|uniref:peptidoglycan-binding domain-containing protein n=1 Tax=Planktothrix agardhii TaxID=1160 RepID=UPI001B923F7C|nr:peptidoglycan-binding protein [Planktothrix agardhii]CAD0231475.1 hypothetical protein PL10110_620046 [Planktothrix agardhii]
MDTLGCIQAWLIWQEQQEQSEVPEIQISSIPGLLILILILTPLIDLHPVLAAQLLARGSRGQEIVALQNDLKQAGCFPQRVRSTGYYGKTTERAVKKLQGIHGLTVDGVVGKQTRNALKYKSCFLKVGSRGEKVRQLQVQLNNWGFPVTKVDGVFGKETRAAVIRFQNYHGLKPDGIAGPKTAKVLWTPRTQVQSQGSKVDGVVGQETRIALLDKIIEQEDSLSQKEFEIVKKLLQSKENVERYETAIALAWRYHIDNNLASHINKCYLSYDPQPSLSASPAGIKQCETNIIQLDSEQENLNLQLKTEDLEPVLNEALEVNNNDLIKYGAASSLVIINKINLQNQNKIFEILSKNLMIRDDDIPRESAEVISIMASYNPSFFTNEKIKNMIDIIKKTNLDDVKVSIIHALGNIAVKNSSDQAIKAIQDFAIQDKIKDTVYSSIAISILGEIASSSNVKDFQKNEIINNLTNIINSNKKLDIKVAASSALGNIAISSGFTESQTSEVKALLENLLKTIEKSKKDRVEEVDVAYALSQVAGSVGWLKLIKIIEAQYPPIDASFKAQDSTELAGCSIFNIGKTLDVTEKEKLISDLNQALEEQSSNENVKAKINQVLSYIKDPYQPLDEGHPCFLDGRDDPNKGKKAVAKKVTNSKNKPSNSNSSNRRTQSSN